MVGLKRLKKEKRLPNLLLILLSGSSEGTSPDNYRLLYKIPALLCIIQFRQLLFFIVPSNYAHILVIYWNIEPMPKELHRSTHTLPL